MILFSKGTASPHRLIRNAALHEHRSYRRSILFCKGHILCRCLSTATSVPPAFNRVCFRFALKPGPAGVRGVSNPTVVNRCQKPDKFSSCRCANDRRLVAILGARGGTEIASLIEKLLRRFYENLV